MDPFFESYIQTSLLSAKQDSNHELQSIRNASEAGAVAEDFEATFLAHVIENMMGESTQSSFDSGPGSSAFKSLLNEEYAKVIAKNGGIGLADVLTREILAQQEIRDQ